MSAGGVSRRVLPGFGLSLGYTVAYLGILVLIPLAACLAKAASLGWDDFWAAAWTPRVRAAYALTFGVSAAAAAVNVVLGLVVAWTLVRYDFPGRRLFDALVDVPLALPTAVAGLVYAGLYAPNGWLGQYLVPLGIEAAYSRTAIVLVLVFTGFPFVVRTVQPVLADLDAEAEEAAAMLGASRWQTFLRVILPTLIPPALTGFALAFARGLGEYGSVVFVTSNIPFRTEIAPVLVVSRLEEFQYAEAAALATMLLAFSFGLLAVVNVLERWTQGQGAAPPRVRAAAGAVLGPLAALGRLATGAVPENVAGTLSAAAGAVLPTLLRGLTILTIGVLVIVPLANVFAQAFSLGAGAYWRNLTGDPDTRYAVFLTMFVAPVAVALNVVFGVAAAWLIARFRFPGRTLLTTVIDIPFSVSPVVAGLMFVLLFGMHAPLGQWLKGYGYQVIFAPPALVLATAFVTFPFVARELIPVLEAVGPDEELAARSLGASGWQLFWKITLPNVKWGVLYGVILCNARAMGEFGAVYVVGGRIGGQTDTVPLQIQKLAETSGANSGLPAAFALASVLTLLAVGTLVAKVLIEPRLREADPPPPAEA